MLGPLRTSYWWTCPKCGVRGKLRHRYLAGLPPADNDPFTNMCTCEMFSAINEFCGKHGAREGLDPGPCRGQLLLFTPEELAP